VNLSLFVFRVQWVGDLACWVEMEPKRVNTHATPRWWTGFPSRSVIFGDFTFGFDYSGFPGAPAPCCLGAPSNAPAQEAFADLTAARELCSPLHERIDAEG
jgi:hypothetical protein